MSTDTNNLTSVDFFKLFFAICIVALHSQLLDIFPAQLNWDITHLVFRLGVPYFFVASGYFWGLKVNKNNADTLFVKGCRNNYIKKNLPPFLFWSFLGLVLYGFKLIVKNGISAVPLILKTALFYPPGAMWFVSSCIVAVVIIAAISDKNKLLLLLGGAGYLFALICNTYYFVIYENHTIKTIVDAYMNFFISARNGIFVGLIFVGFGFLLSKKDNFLKRMKTRDVAILFILSYALLAAETVYTYGKLTIDDNSLFVASPFVSVLLFELTLRIVVKSVKVETLLEARRMSVNIYYMHPFLVRSLRPVANFIGLNHALYFIIIIFLCLTIYFITKKSQNRYIRMALP